MLESWAVADRKLNILTVDDELPISYSIRFALGHPARSFSTAGDGADALAKVQAQAPPFDIVITDNNMPRLNGLELVRRLRELSFRGKIIVLSAHLSDEVQRAYQDLHVDWMLPKPFDLSELRQVVDEIARAA